MDEATAKLMAEKGIWLSTQPFVSEDDMPPMAGQSRINLLQVIAGTNTAYALAKEHKIKTAFGTDLLFSSTIAENQGLMLTHLARWYDNADVLKMATSVNGELLALSGPRNPYEESWESSKRARLPICWWSTAIPSKTSSLSPSRTKTSWSS